MKVFQALKLLFRPTDCAAYDRQNIEYARGGFTLEEER